MPALLGGGAMNLDERREIMAPLAGMRAAVDAVALDVEELRIRLDARESGAEATAWPGARSCALRAPDPKHVCANLF